MAAKLIYFAFSDIIKYRRAWYWIGTHKNMKVIFRSKDFASIDGAGLGFNNRRPMATPWHYQGRVQHRDWHGTYQCHWDGPEITWTVQGDQRLFGLAAALKSRGYSVDVKQDEEQ